MSSLLKLANETIYQILGSLRPDDIVNFALCCKEINVLAQDALQEHRERLDKYTHVFLHGCYRHDQNVHPLRLIREICVDWRIALYPRSMSIRCCKAGVDDDEFDDVDQSEEAVPAERQDRREEDGVAIKSILQDYSEDIWNTVWKYGDSQMHDSQLHPTGSQHTWYRGIELGNQGYMLGLLLLLLPNLETMSHPGYSGSAWQTFHHILCCIASASQEVHRLFRGLTKLNKIAVYTPELSETRAYNVASDLEGVEPFVPYAKLPSMRCLRGNGLKLAGTGLATLNWPYGARVSEVTEIDFRNSVIEPKLLSDLLGGLVALRRFSYEYKCVYGTTEIAKVNEMIKVLFDNARHSLEYLSLTGDWHIVNPCIYQESRPISLREFVALRDLRIDIGTLCLKDFLFHTLYEGHSLRHTAWQELTEVLSPSIETLEVLNLDTMEQVAKILRNVAEKKSELSPNLNKITLTSKYWEEYQVRIRPYVEAWDAVGVKLHLCQA